MEKIYLDYNASTPIDQEVLKAMLPYLFNHFGNSSSKHWAGNDASAAIKVARNQVAELIQCKVDEVIFTSGGSEANNHALKGVYFSSRHKGDHIITTKIEHPAIFNPCKFLEKIGAKVTYVDVDANGMVKPEEIEKVITDKTILISVMHANNEVGTIQPIKEISKIAKKYNVLMHTDAAQSLGKIQVNVNELGIDLLSIAGHKLYAPKGVGVLYIKKGTPIEPIIHGASHEGEKRAGTENTPYIVALGKACEIAMKNDKNEGIRELRNYFWKELERIFNEKIVLNGQLENCLPNTLSVSFLGMIGDEILSKVPEIAASTGSACHSGLIELSRVLKAMGVNEDIGMGTIRFSLGRYTTKDEIDRAVKLLKEKVKIY